MNNMENSCNQIPVWTKKTKIYYILYLLFAAWLPETRRLKCGGGVRRFFADKVCEKIHPTANIEKWAHFNPAVRIGELSSIGVRCDLDGPVFIGKYVMMGPDVAIYTRNHKFASAEKPMIFQGIRITYQFKSKTMCG